MEKKIKQKQGLKKKKLEPYMEQMTGSKLGKGYD